MTHSDEAIAAYPFDRPEGMSEGFPLPPRLLEIRTAFDAGRASVQAQQYAATREALATALVERFPNAGGGYDLIWEDALDIADALLASRPLPAPTPAGDDHAAIVAEALRQHGLDLTHKDPDNNHDCLCGQWRDGGDEDWDHHMAEVAVAALEGQGQK